MPVGDHLLSALGAALAPAIGLLLRSSRRNRMTRRIEYYLDLAENLEQHDPASAADVREMARQTVQALLARDRQALARKLDPATWFGGLLVASPGAVVFVLGVDSDGWWAWVALVGGGVWLVACFIAVLASGPDNEKAL